VRLAAHGLDIGYPGKPVGRDISCEAVAGDILCLLGPNSSGKTTLFRTLLGLIPAQGGAVTLGGDPIAPSTAPRSRGGPPMPRRRTSRHSRSPPSRSC
jgi:ABC-type cobalamin/Fe3+-siderophores transport system ATPase subunit